MTKTGRSMLVVLLTAVLLRAGQPGRLVKRVGGGGKFRFMKNKMTGYIQLNETFSPQDHVREINAHISGHSHTDEDMSLLRYIYV